MATVGRWLWTACCSMATVGTTPTSLWTSGTGFLAGPTRDVKSIAASLSLSATLSWHEKCAQRSRSHAQFRAPCRRSRLQPTSSVSCTAPAPVVEPTLILRRLGSASHQQSPTPLLRRSGSTSHQSPTPLLRRSGEEGGVNHACSVLRHSCAIRESTSHRQCPAVASTLEGTFCSAQRTCGTSQATPRSVLARHVDDQHHGSCKVFMTLQRSSYVEKEFRTPRCFNVEYCRILHSGRRRDAQVLRREHRQTCVEPFA